MLFCEIAEKAQTLENPKVQYCPKCTSGSMQPVGTTRFLKFELNFSVAPLSYSVKTKCDHCGFEREMETLPEEYRQSIFNRWLSFPKMLGDWLGVILLLTCVMTFGYLWFTDTQEQKQWLLKPQIGDIYAVDYTAINGDADPLYPHRLLQIHSMDDDSVTFLFSLKAFARAGSAQRDVFLQKWLSERYFSQNKVTIARDKLMNISRDASWMRITRDAIYKSTPPARFVDGWEDIEDLKRQHASRARQAST